MKKFIFTSILAFQIMIPFTASAASFVLNDGTDGENLTSSGFTVNNPSKKPSTIGDIFQGFSEWNLAGYIPTLVAIGLVTFLAGVLRFIGAGDDAEKRASGQKVMVFGIAVLFVMMSYWGFVAFFTRSFLGENPAIPNYLPPTMTY